MRKFCVGLGYLESEEQSLPSDEENEISNLFKRFAEVTHVNPAMTVQDFIRVDETIERSQEMFVAEIVSSIQQSTEPEEDFANDADIAIPPITRKTALQAMEQVHTFVMQQNDSGKTTTALQLAYH